MISALDVYRDYGPVSVDLIYDFANKNSIVFPKAYVELLSVFNGVRLNRQYFEFINAYSEVDARDIIFFGFGYLPRDANTDFNIKALPKELAIEKRQPMEAFDNNLIAFGISYNGDYIAFDYRGDVANNPPIVLVHHDDVELDQNGDYTRIVSKVADSFEAFLDKLYVD